MAETKTLVAYYSRTGATRTLAQAVAMELEAELEEIRDRKKRTGPWLPLAGLDAVLRRETQIEAPRREPADYDLVVVGTPVWAWSMAAPVRTYLRRNRGALPRVAFFAVARAAGAGCACSAMEKETGRIATATLAVRRADVLGDRCAGAVRWFADRIRAG
ncbi:MAG: flavodoxin family protein [Planctomycetota bacterium]